jgi:hypothetical protein
MKSCIAYLLLLVEQNTWQATMGLLISDEDTIILFVLSDPPHDINSNIPKILICASEM